jgi:hypothetical protein
MTISEGNNLRNLDLTPLCLLNDLLRYHLKSSSWRVDPAMIRLAKAALFSNLLGSADVPSEELQRALACKFGRGNFLPVSDTVVKSMRRIRINIDRRAGLCLLYAR